MGAGSIPADAKIIKSSLCTFLLSNYPASAAGCRTKQHWWVCTIPETERYLLYLTSIRGGRYSPLYQLSILIVTFTSNIARRRRNGRRPYSDDPDKSNQDQPRETHPDSFDHRREILHAVVDAQTHRRQRHQNRKSLIFEARVRKK